MPHVLWCIGGMLIYAGLWTLGAGALLALMAVLLEAARRIT